MTAADAERFGLAVRRMARSFNRGVEQALIEDWFTDLKGYSIGLIERALEQVRQSSHYWPKPAVLLEACRDLALRDSHSGGFDIPSHVDHNNGQYACEVCEDTGFERKLVCDGSGVCHIGSCQRAYAIYVKARRETPELDIERPYAHQFTRPCRCRATNPVLCRERAAMQRPAEGSRA